MNTLATGLQQLSADEIDSVAGALGIVINLGFVKLAGSITEHGASGHIQIGDGPWHGGSFFYDELPKPA
jgi:hypothetical protein